MGWRLNPAGGSLDLAMGVKPDLLLLFLCTTKKSDWKVMRKEKNPEKNCICVPSTSEGSDLAKAASSRLCLRAAARHE